MSRSAIRPTLPTLARLAAALAVAALAPAPAAATDLVLRLDLGYERLDVFTPGAEASAMRLDFDVSALAAGYLFAPGTVDWSLGGRYDRLRREAIGGATMNGTGVSFRGRVGLLNRPTAPLSLQLHASRASDDFTTTGVAESTGTRLVTTLGADATYRGAGRPSLRLGIASVESEDTGFGRGVTSRSVRQVRAGATHGTAAYSYVVDYDARLSTGTYDNDNHDTHTVYLTTSANLGPGFTAIASDRYYLRTPTRQAPTNPRYEDHAAFASVVWSGPQSLSRTQYRYGHTTISAPGVATRERIRNSAFQQVEHQLTGELRLIGLVDASVADERLGEEVHRSFGESLTGLARWIRHAEPWDFFLQGGPSVGLIQPDGAAADTGFGGQFEAGATRTWPGLRAGLRYSAGFQQNLGAVGGWAARQSVTADAERTAGDSLLLRGSLQASADRVQSDLFGAGANRVLQANLTAGWRRYDLTVQAGLTSGLVGDHPDVAGDGLFIPAPYDAHTGYASATFLAPVPGGFDLSLRARYLEIRSPDRERQWETGLLGRLGWTAGGLTVSVEDEYVRGGGEGGPASQNRLFLRLTRTFGTRF
ncbi:MAG: hypothetical protein IPO09_09180 [Anaeromyxobacter sp.]|nr:hypothetical protein [Anaeromyxobacter sp.]MBL0277595.1 hypothetical protein [Anaeromyxobacter sp.]